MSEIIQGIRAGCPAHGKKRIRMNEADAERGRLIDEAIDLAIRHQNDPGNPVAAEMLRSWRARSPEHERIWQRVARIHGAAGEALGELQAARAPLPHGLSRRTFVVGGALGLTAAGAGWYMMPDLLRRARADYATGTGEVRRIALPDGSTATLGPDSAIALDFHPDIRRIELIGGMSFFDVGHEAKRPFQVTSGELAATARGTAFDISSDAGVVTVEVDSGVVEVEAASSPGARAMLLRDGEWMAYDTAAGAVSRGRRNTGQIGAWRDRLVIADQEAVASLVARIGRWLPGRIVIAAPELRTQRVSGIFDLNDPERALQAVVHPAGGHVRRLSNFLTVISPI